MGFTPRGRGGFRGGRGGGRFDNSNQGPPDQVVEVGTYHHACQEDIVCKLTNEKIPHFNAFVYLENKEEVGKVDDIFGPIKDAFYMDPYKFLPLERVLNPNASRGRGGRGGPGGRGGSRGGRGGDFRGGRGDSRGGRGDFRGGRGDFRGGRDSGRGDFRGGRGGDSRGGRGGDSRGGRGGDSRGGRGGDFRGGRGGGRGDFRGGRDSGRGDFRGRGRGNFGGGRENNDGKRDSSHMSFGTPNQGKKTRLDGGE